MSFWLCLLLKNIKHNVRYNTVKPILAADIKKSFPASENIK